MNISSIPQALRRQHMQRFSGMHQRGLSLIEFLIAITLGLMIVTALTVLIAQQSATQAEFEKSSRQIENGRYAMQILSDDLQMAGYYGEFTNVAGLAVPATLSDPCSTTASAIEAALPFAVQGYDALPATGGGTAVTCIAASNFKPGTDILVVRRVEPASAAVGAAVANQIYVQSGLTASGLEFTKKMDLGSNAGTFDLFNKDRTSLATLRRALVHIYFVSPCSVTPCNSLSDGGKPIPTLKVMELTTAGMTLTPLVEGIENMQIDYGIDTTADGSPDGAFVAAPAAAASASWANVMALRVYLMARNNESSPGYTDTKTYTLGTSGAASAPVGATAFKRRVFSQLIRLTNPSGRRDQ